MGVLRLISSAAKSRSIFRTSRKAINNFRSSATTTCARSYVSSSPWLMLPPEQGGRVFPFYSVADNKLVSFNNTFCSSMLSNISECEFVGSSHGWLALFNPHNADLFLLNPLTSRSIKLPPMDTIFTPTETINAWVYKIILTCPPDQPPQDSPCRAVMMYNGYDLAYCSPGSSTRWIGPIHPRFAPRPDDWGKWGQYHDFVHYTYPEALYPMNNLLIAIGDGLEAWNIHSDDDEFQPNRLVYQNRHLLYEEFHRIQKRLFPIKHLVEYDRQIFLVSRESVYKSDLDKVPYDDDPAKTLGFHVHKIGRTGLLGEREGSLNGLAMFVGCNHAFALRAADYPGLMPNSIYFTQHWSSLSRRSDENTAFGGHDIGVFDYQNNTISPCYYPCDMDSFKRIVPYPLWFTPSPNDF